MFVYLRKKKLSQVIANVSSMLGKVVLLVNSNSATAKGSVIDSSNNGYSLTTSSTTITQSAYSPFGTVGGSISLDGSSRYSLPSSFNASTAILGNKKTTIEFWVNITTVQAVTAWVISLLGNDNSVAANGRWIINLNGAGATAPQTIGFWYTIGTGSAASITTTASIAVGTWNHIAITFDATTPASTAVVIYVNGVGQSFNINLSTHTADSGVSYLLFGGYQNQAPLGYVSNFRIVQTSSLVYIGNFTPPTAPLTAITGTQLLVSGTGYNNNNSFVDSSTNNMLVTRAGTVSQGTFTPYQPNGWSGYFNGGSSLVGAVSNTSLAIPASTDFSIEAWVNLPSPTTEQYLINYGKAGSGGNTEGWHIGFNGAVASQINFYIAGGNFAFGANTVPSANTWTHICIARVSGVVKLYLNGVASSTTWSNTNGSSAIGAEAWGIGGLDSSSNGVPARLFVTGYISNLRVVIGSSAYSANFVPPTTALTAIANTKLLTLQDNRFVDNSGSNLAITSSSVAARAYSPLTTQTAYNPALHGGSAYFDGTSSYLTVPSSTLFSLRDTNFTVEAWIYVTGGVSTYRTILGRRLVSGACSWQLTVSNTNFLNYYDGTTYATTQAIALNTWYHVALVRNGTTMTVYCNGVSVYSGSLNPNTGADTAPLGIGTNDVNSEYFIGYMSDVRIVKGTAVYTSAFTPPTAPLTKIANTNLLLSFTNAQIFDASSKNDIQTVGTARIDSVTKKFGTGSMYVSSGNNLVIPSNETLTLGTGDFTIEAWLNLTASAANSTWYGGGVTNSPVLNINALASVSINPYGTSAITGNYTFTLNTWYHVSICRKSNVTTIFVNGAQVISATDNTNYVQSSMAIGSIIGGTQPFTGYIDDLRVTKSAVYTSTFTPPTLEISVKTDANDPFFSKNILAVQGTSQSVTTIPSTNSLIVDVSLEGNPITRFGTPYQGTFSPFESNWSMYLNGSSSVTVTMPALGTSVYTIEWYFYPTVAPTSQWYLQCNTDILIGYNAGGWSMTNQGGWNLAPNSTTLPILNQWNHMAVVRSGTGTNQTQLYLNGVAVGSAGTNSANLVQAAWILFSGMTGYVNSFRVTKSVLYTGSYTPPTTMVPLANTVALLFNANRFVDLSTSNLTHSIGGTPTIQPFSPLAVTSVPAAESLSFNGTADYLTAPISRNWIFSGDYTFDVWVYFPTTAGGQIFGTGGSASDDQFQVMPGSGTGSILWAYASIGSNYLTTTANIPVGSWNHIAISRTSNVLKAFVNGVQVYSGTMSATIGQAAINYIGRRSDNVSYFNGYMSNLRIVNGTGLYPSNFTVPTTPLTAVPKTVLLLSGSAGIVDSSGHVNFNTIGNPTVSTAITKFGNSSLYFNGSTDYITSTSSSQLAFSMGDFTVEAWIYPLSYGGSTVGGQIFGTTNAAANGFSFNLGESQNRFRFISNGTGGWADNVVTATGPALNTWSHVAVSRNGTSLRIFVNGTLQGTATIAATFNLTNTTGIVGYFSDGGTTRYFNGYIDEVRVTKGVGRYASSFTVPTAAFADNTAGDPYYANVVTLLHGDQQTVTYPVTTNNVFQDSSANALMVTRTGTPTQGSFSPFNNAGFSTYFSGASDCLIFPSSSNLAFTGDFTVEMWVNLYDINAYQRLFLIGQSGTDYLVLAIQVTGVLEVGINNTYPINYTLSPSVINNWTHIALVRSGSAITLYLNGAAVGTATNAVSLATAYPCFVGGLNWASGYNAHGYLSNVRAIKGTAVYTAPFTPPTSPLTAITGTVLLTCQDNRFKDGSSNNSAPTLAGSPSVSNFVPFDTTTAYDTSANGGSGYFNGSTDYLSTPITMGGPLDLSSTTNWNIEAWVYPLSFNGPQYSCPIFSTTNDKILLRAVPTTASSTALNIYIVNTGGSIVGGNSGGTSTSINIFLNQWSHVALVRSGSSFKAYINGQLGVSLTDATTFPLDTAFLVGKGSAGGTPYWNGYISNLRVIKGTAVYTSTFTPPVSPVLSISGTQLLLNFDKASVLDSSSKLDVLTMGTAKVTPSLYRFSTSSMVFDGSASCFMKIPPSQLFNFGTSDFTVDLWYYKTAQAPASGRLFQNVDGDSYCGVSLTDNAGTLSYAISFDGSTWGINIGAGTLTLTTWHHIVLRRVGSIFSLYLNGVLQNTTVNTGSLYFSATHTPVIGGQSTPTRTVFGYIDDLRITKGKGRYTVEPTAELTL